jgi:PKD repeat protein
VATDAVTLYGPPTAGFTAHPTQALRPLTVVFTDTTTTVPPGDPTLTYLWAFGDGVTSTLRSPTHTYEVRGTYTVTLIVGNAAGSDSATRTDYIAVYEAVRAAFDGGPRSGVAPLTVAYIDRSTGDYDSCTWAFGDGDTSDACADPGYTYGSAGTYTVSLAVSGPGGQDAITRTSYITVYEAVHASFDGTPRNGVVPLTVSFADRSTGDYDSCAWTFGDGGTSTLTHPSHTYETAGTYTVTLTVHGPGGTDTEHKIAYIAAIAEHKVYLPFILRDR